MFILAATAREASCRFCPDKGVWLPPSPFPNGIILDPRECVGHSRGFLVSIPPAPQPGT